MSLKTRYEFTLPRGYVDDSGRQHRTGVMRLATARDELAPLRDPTVTGPDDPRLTILVLTRVVEQLGDLELVTSHDIEGLFAVDLAFLQDFYGVINFGNQDEYEALLQSLAETSLVGTERARPEPVGATSSTDPTAPDSVASATAHGFGQPTSDTLSRDSSMPRPMRAAVEELPRRTS
ncbi:MAG: hypothetical protein ABI083_14615 [Lapillicoccus sp.]